MKDAAIGHGSPRSIGVSSAVLAVLLICASWSPPARAEDSRFAVQRGAELAEMWCTTCHLTGTPGQRSALADAPTFSSLARDGLADAATLSFALLSPHPVMPTFPVTRTDVEALAAYMRSLSVSEGEVEAAPVSERGASTSDDPLTAGREIAQTLCSGCHAISGPGPSPVAGVPPFSILSERYPVRWLEEAFAEGIVVRHPSVQMPEFRFEAGEIDALLTYMESVQAVPSASEDGE